MIKKILVATDGSKIANKAVKYAIKLVQQMRNETSLTLLSVIDTFYPYMQSVPSSITPNKLMMEAKDFLNQATTAYLDTALSECRKKGVKAQMVMRTGHAVEEIVKEARKEKVDLIILGSQGRSALKAAMLGSVAFGVVHKEIGIPVLIVRK